MITTVSLTADHIYTLLGLSLFYAGIILRIIGYKFGDNNAGIIGYLQE